MLFRKNGLRYFVFSILKKIILLLVFSFRWISYFAKYCLGTIGLLIGSIFFLLTSYVAVLIPKPEWFCIIFLVVLINAMGEVLVYFDFGDLKYSKVNKLENQNDITHKLLKCLISIIIGIYLGILTQWVSEIFLNLLRK